MNYLDPKIDCVFKALFGAKGTEENLKFFINSYLHPTQRKAEGLTYMDPVINKKKPYEIATVYDILAKDKYNCLYNLRMQNDMGPHYYARVLYHFTRLLYMQLQKEETYGFLKGVITMDVMNFNCLKSKDYHSTFRVLRVGQKSKDNRFFEECGEIHFLELEKFSKWYKLKTKKDYWTSFTETVDKYEKGALLELYESDMKLKEAFEVLQELNFAPDEEMVYETRRKLLLDEEEVLQAAHYKGEQKDRQEEREWMVIKMLGNSRFSIEDITNMTGLSKEEIKQLDGERVWKLKLQRSCLKVEVL
jgi:predicted transposase/invertase (TIGR01784 family)